MRSAIDAPEVVFDYAPIEGFSYPFGSLVLSESIRAFAADRKTRGLVTRARGFDEKNTKHTYLAHIGFFEHHGLHKGKKPGEAPGNSRYVPFRVLTRKSLEATLSTGKRKLGDAIQDESNRLCSVVLGLDAPTHDHPVAYCFREIIRNVFEHAITDECYVCAQRWVNGKIEIAVVDRGRGVRASLEERYRFVDDEQALSEAVKPGVSRVDPLSQNDEDVWHNSGYGLYVLSELARRTNGQFLLCSGGRALFCNVASKTFRSYTFKGTAVMLSMTRPLGVNLRELLRKIVSEGEKAQPTDAPRPPSKSTRTI